MRSKHNRIFRILNNINLFAAQFPDDRLHAHPFHTDAGTHAIHIAIPAEHSNLRPFASFPGASFDHNRVVVNFRDFLLKEPFHKVSIGTGKNHPSVFATFFHALNNAANPVPNGKIL